MSQIVVNDLTFSYEGSFDNIFEHVSFSIDTDWKLGFLGRNGKGKTTFLNLLLGNLFYTGSITTSVVFDYFPYSVSDIQAQLPAAEFLDNLKDHCELWRVICELEELKESADLLYRPFQSLSLGERTKVLLAVLFSGESDDFLLIDEPTNHLDFEARETVKQYLSTKKGFLLVSHDRDLLDACIDHVLVLNRQTIEVQSGNFSSWWENKKRKDLYAEAENEKYLKEIDKLRQTAARSSRWAAKNEKTKIGFDPIKEHDRSIATRAYIGAKTKKMQNRVKNTEKRIQREIQQKEGLLVDLEPLVDLKVMPLVHHKRILINARDYSLKYTDADHSLLENLTFSLAQGERVTLHGKNGCGKSTLIKMILEKAGVSKNRLPVIENGTCEVASGLSVSYMSQDTSMLKGSISDFCFQHKLDQSLFCSILRQLDLDRVQFSKDLSNYSEGQKKKVLLAASLLTPAHLYIWDEPLNYVDIFSRIQIEDLILKYQPTMLFVEHDIKFCKKIATKTIDL
ncbi:MAG: ribosomal protection-like ABC-F family protein [Lachnospiraceae bacterium]